MIRKVIDRETAHLWMRENLRFSRYDINFMENVARFINDNRPLTIKQNELWEKIVHKYRKQIYNESQNTLTDEDILAKKWRQDPVEFDPSYAPLLWIEDDVIKLQFPFNKDAVADLRTVIQDAGHDYGLMLHSAHHEYIHWNRDERVWRGTAYPTLIRDLYYYAKDHEFAVDKSIQDIVDSIPGGKFNWGPYAEVYGDRYIVSNISPGLLKALPTNEITLNTIRDLVGLGITLSVEFQSYIFRKFGSALGHIAVNRNVNIEQKNIDAVKEWLRSTDNNIIIVHKSTEQHRFNEDDIWGPWKAPKVLVPEKFKSIADMRMTGTGLADYHVFSKDGDNYTLDQGVDCVVFMPGAAFTYESLGHISKKIITVIDDE